MPRLLEPLDMSAKAVSLEKFTAHGKTKLTAEASDLGPAWLQTCYKDTGFLGLAIRSHKTDRVVRFTQVTTLRDREGEAYGWKFEPIDKDGHRITEVIVFND
jgi:hypothetical protein